MPGEDGLSLCRRLRQTLPALRILLLTGYDDKEYLRAALSIGVQEYLLKPAGADTIISSVLKLKEEIMAERDKERRFQAQKDLLDEHFTILQMYFITELPSCCCPASSTPMSTSASPPPTATERTGTPGPAPPPAAA